MWWAGRCAFVERQKYLLGLCSPLGLHLLLKSGLLASLPPSCLGWGLPGKWAPSVLYLWKRKLELPQRTDGTALPALGGLVTQQGVSRDYHTPSFWSASHTSDFICNKDPIANVHLWGGVCVCVCVSVMTCMSH